MGKHEHDECTIDCGEHGPFPTRWFLHHVWQHQTEVAVVVVWYKYTAPFTSQQRLVIVKLRPPK